MANYSLIINSRFRPFEYQELLAPVLMATQAHQALEEAYGDLDTEAAVWDRRTEGSEKAHSLYTNFSRDLASAAETLSKYGLTPQSRRTMLNMRSRYASDITPIAEAWTKRQADIKAQQEALVKDPTHFFNRMANNISLDEYMDNQSLDVLSDNYSGALLTQQVGQAAANLKQTLMKKGELTKLGLPYQYERMLQYGASADEVFAAMSKDPKALPILTKLVEDVMASSGIRNWSSMNGDWANNDMYQRAEAYAMQGLYNAIGTTRFDNFTDSFSMHDALNARQFARQRAARLEDERRAQQQAIIKAWDPNTTDLFSRNKNPNSGQLLTKKGKEQFIQASMNRTNAEVTRNNNTYVRLGWVTRDGKLTSAGKKALVANPSSYGERGAYNGSGSIHDSSSYSGPTRGQIMSFQNTMRSILPGGHIHGQRYTTIESAYQNYTSGAYARAKANQAYTRAITPTAGGDSANVVGTSVMRVNVEGQGLEKAIQTAIQNGSITPIGSFDQKNRLITGNHRGNISRKKFDEAIKNGQSIKFIGNNPYTNQLFFQMTDGTWYHMPQGVYSDAALKIIKQNNALLQGSGLSEYQEAVYGNNIMTQLTQPLNQYKGSNLTPNDGTIGIPIVAE